ncbi:penicillin acylase family protein [Rhodohalobacter mucosus]|uniref:penicillin acylase family protein n=1 Tax=Rhodohalobacter mucosus TaxID=2079485 RepID=UPI001304ED70|nr:penicillin acylase family protein [Rhodohalobacter mucosus]
MIFLVLTGFAVIGIYWTFFKPLPDYSETIETRQLEDPVDIHWDSYGVPYIYADNERDLYFAVGYIHAQERLWQMTLSQISAQGRFAEFFGEDLVELDKYQRTLGFWETAGRIESETDPRLTGLLQSYADGVNEYVRQNRRNLPLQFTLLDVEPIEWTVRHSLAMTRLMAWDQNIHWWSELTFAFLEESLPASRLQELFPEYDDRYPTTMDDSQSRNIAASMLPLIEKEFSRKKILSMEGTQVGSNAWAVHGSRTESGYPILAGDPHMGLSIPGFWFEVHYSVPGHRITGATIPGMPFVVLGNNDHAAWSITNMMADVADFFIETPDNRNPDRYITDATGSEPLSEPFQIRNEVIRVKGSDDQLFRVRETVNGPIVSDLIASDADTTINQTISMSWTGHRVSHETLAVYRMNHAESMQEFEDAVQEFRAPAMNFTYADKENNIAIFSAGAIPIRDFNPLLFRNGSDPEHRWSNMVPYSELPRLVNPDQGYVAHSNNKLHTDSYTHYIGSFWAPPSRIMRVGQLLRTDSLITEEFVQQMQFDAYSEHAREITEDILPMLRGPDSEEFEQVRSYLENWDFNYTPSSTAATIFDLFYLNVAHNTLSDELGDHAYQTLSTLSYLPVRIIHRMIDNNSVFFNNVRTDEAEDRTDIVRQSMRETILQLEERFGNEPYDWRWENVNSLTLKPPLLGEAAANPEAPGTLKLIVQNIFNKGPYSPHGHSMSINKAEYSWDSPFEVFLGPSIRLVVDLSNNSRSFSVLPTGQSGNPLSTHYGDQTDMWLEGRYRSVYKDSTFFQQASYQTMKLLPQSPR